MWTKKDSFPAVLLNELKLQLFHICKVPSMLQKLLFSFIVTFLFILDDEVLPPEIISDRNGGNVGEGHTVFLSADTNDADVYYTTDGSNPVIGEPNTHKYNPNDGVKLEHPGLKFIRAVALIKGTLPSKVLTSR